jgi:hypothetical protein
VRAIMSICVFTPLHPRFYTETLPSVDIHRISARYGWHPHEHVR